MKQVRQITYEEMKEYGDFFRSMRKSLGFNLEQMSQEVGIFRTTLSKWEKGLIIPQQGIYEIEMRFREVVKKKRSELNGSALRPV